MLRNPNPKVQAQGLSLLTGPDLPEALEYLWRFARELHGRSGVSMNGLAPLTPTTILHWSQLKGVRVTPDDVDALIALDGVLLFPGKPENDEAADG